MSKEGLLHHMLYGHGWYLDLEESVMLKACNVEQLDFEHRSDHYCWKNVLITADGSQDFSHEHKGLLEKIEKEINKHEWAFR